MRELSPRFIERRRNRKHEFLFPWSANNLHSDRKAFRRQYHWHHNSRKAQQVKPLAVRPRIKILHRPPFDLPLALTMAKSRNGCGRTKQHGILPHLEQNSFSNIVAPEPGCEKRLARMCWFSGGPR